MDCKFPAAMKRRYCGFSQINAADICLFDGIAVQSVTAGDKRLQLASVSVCSVSTQDIPGAALCDVSHTGSHFTRHGSSGPVKTTDLFAGAADYLQALSNFRTGFR